jgi:uncharacterized protein YjbK
MASNNIEIEAKILLSEADYDKVITKLDFSTANLVQTNYYLDSADRILKKYGMVLRIRQTGVKFVLTMKAPLAEGLLEKNQILSQKDADGMIKTGVFPEGEIGGFLDILHIDKATLKILAVLTTDRKAITYEGTEVNVSKNTYSNITDYEMECDSDSALKSQNTLKEICLDLGIEFVLNNVSKENRAITAALAQ